MFPNLGLLTIATLDDAGKPIVCVNPAIRIAKSRRWVHSVSNTDLLPLNNTSRWTLFDNEGPAFPGAPPTFDQPTGADMLPRLPRLSPCSTTAAST